MSGYTERIAQMEQDEIWKEIEGENPCKDSSVYTSSKISKLDQCEWAYKLENVDLARPEFRYVQAARGSVLHQCIHRLHREQCWDDYGDLFREEWEETIVKGEDADLPWKSEVEDDKIETVKTDGEAMLGGYVRLNRRAKVVSTEVPFRMLIQHPRTKTQYRFAGTIDQLRESDEMTLENQTPGIYVPGASQGWLEIFDTKSGAQAPDAAFLERNTQLTSYGLGLKKGRLLVDEKWNEHGHFPSRMVWYQLHALLPYKRGGTRRDGSKYVAGDLRGTPIYPVVRTADDYVAFEVELCRKVQKIRMKLFTRNVTMIGCSMCRVRNACTSGLFVKQENLMDATDLSGL